MSNPILCVKQCSDEITRTIYGGLHYIKGNKMPYFTITNENGSDNKTIAKWFSEFQDLIDLHNSYINGEPPYAYEDGYFWISSIVDGNFGERWIEDQYNINKMIQILADHLRIPTGMAAVIVSKVEREYIPGKDNHKKRFMEIVDSMRPRWKREANDCIARHNLQIFGAPWRWTVQY